MNKKICDRCGCEIKSGIRLDCGKPYPRYYHMNLKCFSGEGGLCSDQNYHLCNHCYEAFESFLNKDKCFQYVKKNNNDDNKSNFSQIQNFISVNEKDILTVDSYLPKLKSVIKCGHVTIFNTKRFNNFQKKMWKYFFGVDITDYKKE